MEPLFKTYPKFCSAKYGNGLHKLTFLIAITLTLTVDEVCSIQCFSCKGTGLNELLANSNCLENGYLENCDDFYEYYSKVDDKKVLTDYYYEDEYYDYKDDIQLDSPEKSASKIRAKRQSGSSKKEKPLTKAITNGSISDDYEYYVYYVDEDKVDKTGSEGSKSGSDKKSAKSKVEGKGKGDDEDKEDDDDDIIPESSKKGLAKDPEYSCYSTTTKLDWEHYTVEKGCKKNTYCKSLEANKPDWSNPWNFCCDKSRCNAKIVKDKPQRIYGMQCRRTDDCIQGHNSRPVCPYMYKSCPKIPPGVIKMECRAKGIDPTDARHRYRNPFQEKKCYCRPGFFPRGPVCTNASSQITMPWLIFMMTAAVAFMHLNIIHWS